ncbi:MAG: homocysteine S-methyltransferase family protein, partial [Gammaproteobacteria bacterium]|nr:homocysteine S-methyltransferase family protein [Gammaproteobacteria bacterium]
MNNRQSEQVLRDLLKQRILVLDGAMGTMIQSRKLGDAEFRGERFRDHPHELNGNYDLLCLTQPNIIKDIHRAYYLAGADIVETNSFTANRASQADYQLQDITYELNLEAARLAREVCDEIRAQTPQRARFVAGVLGPT